MTNPDETEVERFLAFVDEHAQLAKALLRRIVGDEEDVEDLLADVFATVWEKKSHLCEDLFPWLLEFTRERALVWVKARGVRESVENTNSGQSILPDRPLASLPVMQRRVVEHIFFEGGSVILFSPKTDAPPEWVSTALSHALATLWVEHWN